MRSNILFILFAILLAWFLFGSNPGKDLRAEVSSWLLSTPDAENNNPLHLDHDRWEIQDLEGKRTMLTEYSKPIFLNIWATWCVPCRSELESIEALHQKYGDQVDFMLISPSEDLSTLTSFSKDYNLQAPVYRSDSTPPNQLYCTEYPTTFIINKDKAIVWKVAGASDWNAPEVHQLMEDLIHQ